MRSTNRGIAVRIAANWMTPWVTYTADECVGELCGSCWVNLKLCVPPHWCPGRICHVPTSVGDGVEAPADGDEGCPTEVHLEQALYGGH